MSSIAHSTETFSALGYAALALAGKGYAVFPLHPRAKEPLPIDGFLSATTDAAKIERWWTSYHDANIGIALAQSGLLIIGPDNEVCHARFKGYGLPDTYTVKSGNGRHYYYRLPDGWPITRRCVSQQYDILSNGYIVGAGSIHPNGSTYTALNDLPLADAPDWVLAELKEAEDTAEGAIAAVSDEPPVQLSASDMAWWGGTRYAVHEDGTVDRSGTLYALASRLARKGLSQAVIAGAIANRDTALFAEPKYANRNDPARAYLSLTRRAMRVVGREKQERAETL